MVSAGVCDYSDRGAAKDHGLQSEKECVEFEAFALCTAGKGLNCICIAQSTLKRHLAPFTTLVHLT